MFLSKIFESVDFALKKTNNGRRSGRKDDQSSAATVVFLFQVTIALTVNSVLYTMFAALQLFLFIVGNVSEFKESPKNEK